MFEVNVDGKQYRISYKYFDDESVDPRDLDQDSGFRLPVRATQVNLYRIIDGEKVIVAWAKSQCSVTENFIKDAGRKQALTRLMGFDLTPHSREMLDVPNQLDMPDFMDKRVRAAFWQAYFGRQDEDRIRNEPRNPDAGWPRAALDKMAAQFVQREADRHAIANLG